MSSRSQPRPRPTRPAINLSSPARPSDKHGEASTPISPPRSGSTRPKKNASVTPKRFARFFTPRSSLGNSNAESGRKRSALDAVDEDPLNNRSTKRRLFPTTVDRAAGKQAAVAADQDAEPELPPHPQSATRTERDASVGIEPSSDMDWLPTMSSPCMRRFRQPSVLEAIEDDDVEDLELDSYAASSKSRPVTERTTPAPLIKRFENMSFRGRMLHREFGNSPRLGRASVLARALPYQSTFLTSLCSTAANVWSLHDLTPAQETVVPFSMTTGVDKQSTHLTLIGDSSGTVQVFRRSPEEGPYVDRFWRAHENAITAIDLRDAHIATASSDRTARVIDFETGQTVINLGPNEAALRDIKFRPSDPHVVLTSSRGGIMSIFDIRHKQPTNAMDDAEVTFMNPRLSRAFFPSAQVRHAKSIYTICRANTAPKGQQTTASHSSITAVQWLPNRDHLFISAGEGDASISLWDSRYIPRNQAAPLAHTQLPTGDPHYTRNFGVTSLSLGSDGTRVYSTCRNNSIYAYSLPHLILGQALELEPLHKSRLPHKGQDHVGLGPLYSLRHESLHIDSFWIKSSIQSVSVTGAGDMLAVGNSAIHPIVFNVEEKTHRAQHQCTEARIRFLPTSSADAESQATNNTRRLPCVMNGVVLRSGNDNRATTETTSVAWQADGSLVTVDDESRVRFWRHDDRLAAQLRAERADAPVRFMHGWADVPRHLSAFDSEDDGQATSLMEFRESRR
ncbi:hypothetical protein BROUX41_005555 [Berkeleyomyces rouxiae]